MPPKWTVIYPFVFAPILPPSRCSVACKPSRRINGHLVTRTTGHHDCPFTGIILALSSFLEDEGESIPLSDIGKKRPETPSRTERQTALLIGSKKAETDPSLPIFGHYSRETTHYAIIGRLDEILFLRGMPEWHFPLAFTTSQCNL